MTKKLIDMKNLLVVKEEIKLQKKSNYKAIQFSDMDSHVRWTMSRPGPHKKNSLKESYTGSSKMIKNS